MGGGEGLNLVGIFSYNESKSKIIIIKKKTFFGVGVCGWPGAGVSGFFNYKFKFKGGGLGGGGGG